MLILGYVPSVRVTRLRTTSLKNFIDDVRDEKTRASGIVKKIRYQAIDIDEKSKKNLKENLPAICTGHFSGGDKRLSRFRYAEAIIIDIDHITPDKKACTLPDDPLDIHELKMKAREESTWIGKHCQLLFRSPSGDGVKMLFLFNNKVETPQHFRAVWEMIADKIIEEWGITPDKACKDPTRLCFYSYDPAIYVNEKATPVDVAIAKTRDNQELNSRNTASIKLRPGQEQGFLEMIKGVKVRHYPEFRDIMSAASRLGKKFLSYAYDVLYDANKDHLSEQTATALQDKEKYIRSFLTPHERVPLQIIPHTFLRQGGKIEKTGKSSTRPMFNLSDRYAEIIQEMNRRYASYQNGESVIIFPWRKTKYNIIQSKHLTEAPGAMHVVAKRTHLKADLANKRIRYIAENGNIISREVFDIWWNSPQRRRCEKIVCLPRDAEYSADPLVYNLWQGFNVRPEILSTVTEYDARPILEFIYNVIANRKQNIYDYIINWTAEMIQNPTPRKPGICLGLIGAPGTGKGTFAEILHDLIGMRHTQRTEDMKGDILDNFNALTEGKLLIILNEAFYQHDRRLIESFKGKITETTKVIQPKYVSKYNIPDIARYLILTNHEHVVHLDKNDRRFFLTEVSSSRKEDKKYFASLRRYVAAKGREAFYKYLMQYNVNYERLNTSDVQTSAMLFNKRASFDTFDRWLSSVIFDAKITYPSGNSKQVVSLEPKNTVTIGMDDLYKSYSSHSSSSGRKTAFLEYEFVSRMMRVFQDAGLSWKIIHNTRGMESLVVPSYIELLKHLPMYSPSTRDERIQSIQEREKDEDRKNTYPTGDLPF